MNESSRSTESSNRRVIGSSSMPTRRSSSDSGTLSEGFEAERWAKLAGIIKG